MARTTHTRIAKVEEFSLPLFAFTILSTLAGLFVIMRFAAPSLWDAQLNAPFWKGAVVFAAISMTACFIEYFFHRYVLHQPAIPLLRRLYRQHTLHHGLTHITRRHRSGGRRLMVVENKFPIIEPEQKEASFFPWFTLAIFAAILTPLLIGLHLVLPSFPWFVAGFLALATSMTLYELLHAINHWPLDKWLPLIEHPRWSWFWHPVYSFHLRHHAVIDCNESVSGFFGLPVADWCFGTCVIPKSIYADGAEWSESEFTRPRPVWLIRKLDDLAVATVQRRRTATHRGPVVTAHPDTEATELASQTILRAKGEARP